MAAAAETSLLSFGGFGVEIVLVYCILLDGSFAVFGAKLSQLSDEVVLLVLVSSISVVEILFDMKQALQSIQVTNHKQ